MIHQKTAYELSESQVTTPKEVVNLFWRLTSQYRPKMGAVLDLGAGDARFARSGKFEEYVGLEIDRLKIRGVELPRNAKLINNCAFKHRRLGYDACIGNPPYVRHHDIESPWKEQTTSQLNRSLDVCLNLHCNLYLYFFCLAVLKTHEEGLVALVIPYEWVSRPSAKPLREHICKNDWNVTVYRFQYPIFDTVLTTASISIVDKSKRDGKWTFFDLNLKGEVILRNGVADSARGIIKHSPRGKVWALRGLSPGTQKVFTLTEGERIHSGLSREDVVPCITTLKSIPRSLSLLNQKSFQKHLIDSGARCWLIKSFETHRSAALDRYLDIVPELKRNTFTCRHQTPWYNYKPHPIPKLLVSSGFTKFGPKILINSVGASAVGSVMGVHSKSKIPARDVQRYLRGFNFETRVVAHAKTLKKIEVQQLNSVLNAFKAKASLHGRTA